MQQKHNRTRLILQFSKNVRTNFIIILAASLSATILNACIPKVFSSVVTAFVLARGGYLVQEKVIAHRLSTIRNADMILVVDDGKIKEMGNHRDLIRAKGCYYELFSKQFAEEKMRRVLSDEKS